MFEVILPAAVTLALVLLLCPFLIQYLKKLQLTQPIRKELPEEQQVKHGTPLMTGSIFLLGIIIALIYSSSEVMLFLCTAFVLYSVIGFLDDYWKASRQDPNGMSGKMKLILQFIVTGLLLYIITAKLGLDTNIQLFNHWSIDFPFIIYLLTMAVFVVGSTNAINFTDGMDGLLGVVAIPTYFFFFVISDIPEIQVFCLIMIANILGFLMFNIFPAKAFMGDTGSLAIGGSLAFLAIIEKVEIIIPLLFFIYFAEQLSVVIQVFVYKRTQKRVFQMTPIHYHFSLKYGWTENAVVIVFGFISWVGTFISYGYWKYFLS
ncbi:phospho-N-acetylmuramoyl-pentapeptide-transferase [Bacillus oleivorans]|uniref:Phospho-N-acetylmuramoyl-pentapeptide-transferase n=1 Tax=Bacillus oleivorans TaxID=1448271 RepID=A0A285CJU0_9BACI|nr:phospho-N-acetylmuramoyl-pentapeptide-transferase [Bacillus oleivorans]SNX67298.1 phospho-N-acetylmuramoyl-pentapeptide-transferase [Bacillus oleivorans]